MNFDSSDLMESDDQSRLAQIQESYRALRTLFHCLSIALLILTGTFFIYLYREVVVVRHQTRELLKLVNDYERSSTKALIKDFQTKMYQYSQDHPDFRPIYGKYYGTNTVSTLPGNGPAHTVLSTNGPLQNLNR